MAVAVVVVVIKVSCDGGSIFSSGGSSGGSCGSDRSNDNGSSCGTGSSGRYHYHFVLLPVAAYHSIPGTLFFTLQRVTKRRVFVIS